MEIGPIVGVRALPEVKVRREEQHIHAIFDIENSTGAQDETTAQSGRDQAGGQDDELPESDEQAESRRESTDDDSGSTVNLFA